MDIVAAIPLDPELLLVEYLDYLKMKDTENVTDLDMFCLDGLVQFLPIPSKLFKTNDAKSINDLYSIQKALEYLDMKLSRFLASDLTSWEGSSKILDNKHFARKWSFPANSTYQGQKPSCKGKILFRLLSF